MADIFELNAEMRHDRGKGASRRLRREAGLVPAIVYGAGKDPVSVSLVHNKVIRALEDESFYSRILTINLEKKKEKVVLKDLQRHPYKRQVLHMDFLRIRSDTELTMNIPLHFIGEDVAPGVKLDGGVIARNVTEIEVRCLPGDLPEFIEVDISNLGLNETIHLSNIKLPEKVTLTADLTSPDNDMSVLSIYIPQVEEEPEEVEPPVETEITTAKAEEESAEESKES